VSHDLTRLIAAVDLEALADQLLGGHRGHGSGCRWRSPVPDHPQTGRTPPMSIFTDRSGVQRWTCWATGRSGTAIDLVATALRLDVGDAITWLNDRHGQIPAAVRQREQAPTHPTPGPSAALHAYTAACQQLLWTRAGRTALGWLTDRRCIDRATLRANRVGYDPGPARLPRPRGLPFRGPGVVLPTFDQAGQLVYVQVRYLDADTAGRKYDNPSAVHGTKPPLSWPRPSQPPSTSSPLLICEGTLDAMTVTTAGIAAVALIAAGDAHQAVAAIAAIDGPLVIAVDNDPAGHSAARILRDRLLDAGRGDVAALTLPGDVNELAQRTGWRFPAVLRAAVRGAHTPRRLTRSGPCP